MAGSTSLRRFVMSVCKNPAPKVSTVSFLVEIKPNLMSYGTALFPYAVK